MQAPQTWTCPSIWQCRPRLRNRPAAWVQHRQCQRGLSSARLIKIVCRWAAFPHRRSRLAFLQWMRMTTLRRRAALLQRRPRRCFFAMDEESDDEVTGEEEDGNNGGMRRQTSFEERYDAFESMSRASLAGNMARRDSIAHRAGVAQAEQAFDMDDGEKDDASSNGGDDAALCSLDWQYDALDAGNAIAAVAGRAGEARQGVELDSPVQSAGDVTPGCGLLSPSSAEGGHRPLSVDAVPMDYDMVPALPRSEEVEHAVDVEPACEGTISKIATSADGGDVQLDIDSDASSLVSAAGVSQTQQEASPAHRRA
mmetsp:Transcript_163932/g.521103  ORF Transcript_163932/g.521103 Transcript_163932/m.521103 type:complete len:311 (-) Transcript_163932:152-1084(-)